jgi:hypothetical protein
VGGEGLYWSSALRFVKGAGGFAGSYDANGNMVARVVNGGGFLLSYDAENHLVQVQSSTLTATFVYDGNGVRVKATINGTTTVFAGSHYELTDSGVTKLSLNTL